MLFSNELALHIRWSKYWSFSFSISSSNEYSGLISFRIDWFDLLEVQGTLKGLLQHHSLKVSILWCSAFFIVQFSHPYMTTGKAIALTIQTFVGKIMSLLFILFFYFFFNFMTFISITLKVAIRTSIFKYSFSFFFLKYHLGHFFFLNFT